MEISQSGSLNIPGTVSDSVPASVRLRHKVPILGNWNIPDSLIAKWVLTINTAWSSPVH